MEQMMKQCCGQNGNPDFAEMKEFCGHDGVPDFSKMTEFMQGCGCCSAGGVDKGSTGA